MLVLDLFEDFQGPPEPTLIDALRDFLPLAMRHLNIKNLPKITFVKDIDDSHVSTFGHYNHDEKLIFVDIENRHPNDIIRTLAHELIHYAQGKNKELDHDSWLAGSPVENEANAEAGVIMRKFNTKYPQYLKLKPVMFESVEGSEAEAEEEQEREESDPTKPIPFPKGTTLVNVSDVYDWYKLGMAIPALDKADPRTFHKGVPHTVFAFGSEEEEHKMIPLLKRLGFSLHDIDTQDDYQKAIRASDVIEHLERYVAENATELDEKWSKKYKKSINCSNPKGFSQKAHCAARRARQAGKTTKSKSVSEAEQLEENLRDWFKKEKWVRMDTKGNIKGPCAREPGEGKPKCLPQAKAHSLGKKGRASAAQRKRREDPNPERKGKAINVSTKESQLDEKCWKGYHKEGNKKMFGKTVPNCVKNENQIPFDQCPQCGGEIVHESQINEKKDACYHKVKSRYKVWPSAYASGALVQCRKKGAKNWGNKSK